MAPLGTRSGSSTAARSPARSPARKAPSIFLNRSYSAHRSSRDCILFFSVSSPPASPTGGQETTMRLGDKVAVITGGGSGMGRSEAVLFAKEGAKVVVADVLEAEGRKVADSLGGAGRFVRLDVTSETEWEQAIAAAVSTFGKLDVLVNNAGISGTFD